MWYRTRVIYRIIILTWYSTGTWYEHTWYTYLVWYIRTWTHSERELGPPLHHKPQVTCVGAPLSCTHQYIYTILYSTFSHLQYRALLYRPSVNGSCQLVPPGRALLRHDPLGQPARCARDPAARACKPIETQARARPMADKARAVASFFRTFTASADVLLSSPTTRCAHSAPQHAAGCGCTTHTRRGG